MKNQKRIQTAILLGAVFLGFLVWQLWCQMGTEEQQQSSPVPQDHLPVSLQVFGKGSSQSIRLFEQEDGSLAAFLPGWVDEEQILAAVSDPEQPVQLDGVQITEQAFCPLAPGEHTIRLAEQEPRTLRVYQGSAQLPAMFLTTESGSMDYLHSEKGNEEAGTYEILSHTGNLLWQGEMTMRGRGNTNWSYLDKRSYGLRLTQKADLFGMGTDAQWILLPNGLDPSQLRNHIVYDLARRVGMPYAIEDQFVELYVNGEYRGIYQLCEKVEIGQNRIDIRDMEKEIEELNAGLDFEALPKKLRGYWGEPETGMFFEVPVEPADITGGYLLEMELEKRYGAEASGFISKEKQFMVIQSPKYVTMNQVDYIRGLYQALENAVWSPDGLDPASGQPFWAFMDMTSFAQKFLIEEITKNLEVGSSSQYLYKPADAQSTVLWAGPIWDYDYALASARNDAGEERSDILRDPEGFYVPTEYADFLLGRLYQHPEFQSAVQQQYNQSFLPVIQKQLDTDILADAQQLLPSVLMDAQRWNTWPEAVTPEQKEQCYLQEIQVIRDFLTQRVQWLNQQWPQPAA